MIDSDWAAFSTFPMLLPLSLLPLPCHCRYSSRRILPPLLSSPTLHPLSILSLSIQCLSVYALIFISSSFSVSFALFMFFSINSIHFRRWLLVNRWTCDDEINKSVYINIYYNKQSIHNGGCFFEFGLWNYYYHYYYYYTQCAHIHTYIQIFTRAHAFWAGIENW